MKLWWKWLVFVAVVSTTLVKRTVSLSSNSEQAIIASGNFTLDDKVVNIAKFDLKTQTWSNLEEVLLFGNEFNGVIWGVFVNDTRQPNDIYVVGQFDSIPQSQTLICSMGMLVDSTIVNKGGGLCPVLATSSGLSVRTGVIGASGDVFVGGDFSTRTLAGPMIFKEIHYVARFEGSSGFWMPLEGGQLNSTTSTPVNVTSLVWNAEDSVLYIGGYFTALDDTPISTGLAMWTAEHGLAGLPTGGVANANGDPENCIVTGLAYEPKSKALFVTGNFALINGQYCPSVAVWFTTSHTWMCLYDYAFYMSTVTSMLLSDSHLYVSGWASSSSTWPGLDWSIFYAVARLDVTGLIAEHSMAEKQDDESKNNDKHSSAAYWPEFHRRRAEVDSHLFQQFGSGRKKRGQRDRVPDRSALQKYMFNNQSVPGRVLDYEIGWHFFEPSRRPTPRPSTSGESQWAVQWQWLQGFSGGDGPIMSMSSGMDEYEGCLFLAGAFNNYAATTAWCDPADTVSTTRMRQRQLNQKRSVRRRAMGVNSGNATTDLMAGHHITGLITSIKQVYISTANPAPVPTNPPPSYADITIFILSTIIMLFILVGVGIAAKGLFSNRFNLTSATENVDSISGAGISLTTLSSNQGGALNVNFKECFERAMAARHMNAFDVLVMIDHKDIMLNYIIGEGSFGRVWSGTWRNQNVAIKEFVFAQAAIVGGSKQGNDIIEEIIGEAGVMSHLKHSKILQLHGCTLTSQALWIVSELCIRGSLRSVLMSRVIQLPLIKKLSICMDVADGMDYLHSRTIIHRDLKSHNIFITEPTPGQFVAKIGDWGSARAVQMSGVKSMTHGVGTACWLAPEVINNAHFSKQSDVYAYGIILWEVFTRQEVYEGLSAAQIIAKVAHEELRPNVPRECPWAKVMTACWHRHVNERPDFASILQSLTAIKTRILNHPGLAHAKSGEFKVQDLEQAGLSPARVNVGGNTSSPAPQLGPGGTYTTKPLRFPIEPYSSQTYSNNSFTPPNERTTLLDHAAARLEFHPSLDVEMVNPQLVPQSSDIYQREQLHQHASPVRVPSFRSRPLDYASDPHNYRPVHRSQPQPVPSGPPPVLAPPMVFIPSSDPEDEGYKVGGGEGERVTLLPKK